MVRARLTDGKQLEHISPAEPNTQITRLEARRPGIVVNALPQLAAAFWLDGSSAC